MRSLRAVVFLLVVLSVEATFSWAQSSTTSLRGTVADTQGAVLVGATVTLENPATGFSRTTKSGSDGVYQFLEVPPSTYSLTANASGFAPLKRTNVVLQVSLPATLNLTMTVKGVSETMEVTAAAPMVNTQDATQGDVFGARQLIDLPTEGRDPVAILSLQPGVTYIGSNVDQNVDSRGGSVAGARSDQTNVTVDGMDNNDQLLGNAFQGALYTPLDSLQEFRVTTSNSNADAGRSSGAQVSMVTKSGTNSFHGSLYEYNRTSLGEANDFFNKESELVSGLPNKPGQLIRNTFGASIGGPIKKDRLFFFGDYEGQRTHEAIQTTREVPSDTLRQGIMMYPCDTTDPNCVAGSNADFSVASDPRVASNQLLVTMTPAGLKSMDPNCQGNGTCPWGGGADPNVLAIFNNYPHPNSDVYGDLFNFRAFTFPAHAPYKDDTYIVKLDYKLTPNGNHTLFVKGHLMNDHINGDNQATVSQFPGDPPNQIITNNSKAIMAGYTALISNTLVNNFRYGFIRQGVGTSGLNAASYNVFRGLDNVQGFATTVLTNVPVHNFVDDLSWTKGKHTFQFGGNLRLITNNRVGNEENVSTASSNPEWLDYTGIANHGVSLDPGAFAGYPLVDGGFDTNYDFSVAAVAGLQTEVFKVYNQDKNGTMFAPGAMISRHFRSMETEFYAQDSWRATPNLVLTGGLRYTLLQPPYETNGNQVAPSISLDDWFAKRAQVMQQGSTYAPTITMALSGPANNGKPYWNWNKANLAPRLAFAYSPHFETGFLHSLFGSSGKSSIRGGWGIYYDHFGMGVVNSFDRNGSFGLTTALSNPGGIQQVDCTSRLTGLTTLPPASPEFCGQEMVPTMTPGFPYTPPVGGFEVAWGLDDRLKTPYSHVFDFSITRELRKNFAFEASYVGRQGRRLLQEVDLAMPLDIKDPKSGMDYFTAATMLTKAANAGTNISQMAKIPYWEDLFPAATGMLGFGPPGSASNLGCAPGDSITGNYTATQAMYDMFSCFSGNETTALQYADGAGGYSCAPACSQLPGQSQPTPYNFYDQQFVSLYAWRSQGTSSYNALQLTLRHAMSNGLEFDFSYAFSKSIDIGSNAERINSFEGTGFASQVINAWSPNQLRAVSDFDTTHQLTANWTYDLPFGHGRAWASGIGRVGEAIVGGWSLSGIAHWTSGLPFSIFHGAFYPTDWQLSGTAVEVANPGAVGVHMLNGSPNMFADPSAVSNMKPGSPVYFRHPYPGESGTRNELRGPGYFGIDSGLSKSWKIASEQTLRFSWEAFNVTNSVRFDAAASANQFDLTTGNFGAYSSTLTKPRVMQFSLRYSF
jgi:hypothetical protein